MFLRNVAVDGNDEFEIGMSDTEIGPKESIDISVTVFKDILSEDLTLTFEEHISGELVYWDYDKNRETEIFSEYIIEQE